MVKDPNMLPFGVDPQDVLPSLTPKIIVVEDDEQLVQNLRDLVDIERKTRADALTVNPKLEDEDLFNFRVVHLWPIEFFSPPILEKQKISPEDYLVVDFNFDSAEVYPEKHEIVSDEDPYIRNGEEPILTLKTQDSLVIEPKISRSRVRIGRYEDGQFIAEGSALPTGLLPGRQIENLDDFFEGMPKYEEDGIAYVDVSGENVLEYLHETMKIRGNPLRSLRNVIVATSMEDVVGYSKSGKAKVSPAITSISRDVVNVWGYLKYCDPISKGQVPYERGLMAIINAIQHKYQGIKPLNPGVPRIRL